MAETIAERRTGSPITFVDGTDFILGEVSGVFGVGLASDLRDYIQSSLTLRAVRCYSFQSFSGSSGINYIAGFYDLKAADLNLTNGSPTVTVGTANGA